MPVAIAILIEYAAPVAVVGWLWARHRQVPSRLTVTGAAVAIAGLLLVLDVFSVGSVDGIGVLWALGGMVGCAVFFVLSSGDDNGVPPIVLAAGGLVVGSVGLGLAGMLGLVGMSAGTADATYNGVDVPWWLPLLALGVVTAAVSYLSGILASRLLGARLASFVALLEVLFSVIFAWPLLGRAARRRSSCSAACCCSGVIVVEPGKSEDRRSGVAGAGGRSERRDALRGAARQRPRHSGGRFSAKARGPSTASSDPSIAVYAARSPERIRANAVAARRGRRSRRAPPGWPRPPAAHPR